MLNNSLPPEQFISELYINSATVPLNEFSTWALDLLRRTIHFDGAIWGSGHITTKRFHTKSSLDVSTDIFQRLLTHLDINPIFKHLHQRQGRAVDMSDVISDEQFYHSDIYLKCFQPLGIERILSSIHLNERSGIFTLLTLYRYDRNDVFTHEEKQIQSRLLYHLISCAAHRQMQELTNDIFSTKPNIASALCDNKGIYHAATTSFLDLMENFFNQDLQQKLPVEFLESGEEFTIGNLFFSYANRVIFLNYR